MGETAKATFHSVASSFGLTVNVAKTKFMSCGVRISDMDKQPLLWRDKRLNTLHRSSVSVA